MLREWGEKGGAMLLPAGWGLLAVGGLGGKRQTVQL
jgi:hypothetical protein